MATPADRAALEALGAQPYVRLTTFRRDGTPVATPVWVVTDRAGLGGQDGDLLVTTGGETGKVKRLRHTPRVLLVPCDSRGRVAPGADEVEAVGDVLVDPAVHRRVLTLLLRKHPLGARVIGVLHGAAAVLSRLRRRPPEPSVVLRLTPGSA